MRWIRLDAEFDTEEWLYVLSEGAQLAWIKLQCWTKVYGIRGRVKALNPLVAARRWGVGEESVAKMLAAALAAGKILYDGENWLLTEWAEVQEVDSSAERVRRHRERRKEVDVPAPDVTDETPVTAVTRYTVTETDVTDETDCNDDPCRVTVTVTETEKENPPIGGQKKKVSKRGRDIPPDPEAVTEFFRSEGASAADARQFFNHHEAVGWKRGPGKPILDWKAAARTWISNIPKFGGKLVGTAQSAVDHLIEDWRNSAEPKPNVHYWIRVTDKGAVKCVFGPPTWPRDRRRTDLPFREKLFADCQENGDREWWAAMGLDIEISEVA